MQINLSGQHIEITDSIKEAVNNKLTKIENHYPTLNSVNVIVVVERHAQKVEIDTLYEGIRIAVHAEHNDLYAAIASAAKKLDTALSHRKGQLKANLHEKPELEEEVA